MLSFYLEGEEEIGRLKRSGGKKLRKRGEEQTEREREAERVRERERGKKRKRDNYIMVSISAVAGLFMTCSFLIEL